MPNILHNTLLRASVETVVWVIDGGVHIVSLRNYTGGCKYEISVDGSIQTTGATAGKRQRRKFELPDGRAGAVFTTPVSGSAYDYELQLEDSTVPRDTEGIWSPSEEMHSELYKCVSVPEVRLGDASDGEGMEGVALYKVVLEPQVSGKFQRRAEWKRYNDFDELYTLAISAHFRKEVQHLVSNVPKPPGKTWRRQTDAEYIERRRAELEFFLQTLCRLPRMAHNPDLLLFLGIFDGRANRVGVTEGKPQLVARRTALEPEPEGAGGCDMLSALPADVLSLLEDCTAEDTELAPEASVQSLARLAMRAQGTALIGWLVERLSGSLDDGRSSVAVKTLKLLISMVPKGCKQFRGQLKAECEPLLAHAQNYDHEDPTYGDKPAKMIRKLCVALQGQLLGDEPMPSKADVPRRHTPHREAEPEAQLASSLCSDGEEPLFDSSPPGAPTTVGGANADDSDDGDDCL
jgi:hypothetical protein